PAVPAPDTEFHFQLYTLSSTIESAGMNFNNLTVAAPPAITGPSIACALTQIDGQGFHNLAYATVPVDPQAITGRIVLRLAFDDANDQMTCSYSLDNGATFQSFAPMPVFVGVSDGEFLIGAGTNGGGGPPPPPPAEQFITTKQLSIKNPSVP